MNSFRPVDGSITKGGLQFGFACDVVAGPAGGDALPVAGGFTAGLTIGAMGKSVAAIAGGVSGVGAGAVTVDAAGPCCAEGANVGDALDGVCLAASPRPAIEDATTDAAMPTATIPPMTLAATQRRAGPGAVRELSMGRPVVGSLEVTSPGADASVRLGTVSGTVGLGADASASPCP